MAAAVQSPNPPSQLFEQQSDDGVTPCQSPASKIANGVFVEQAMTKRPPIGATIRITGDHVATGDLAEVVAHESWMGQPTTVAKLIRDDALGGHRVGLFPDDTFKILELPN